MDPYLQPLAAQFEKYTDAARAAGAKAYLRNQFEFFGLTMPLRRRLCKAFTRNNLPAYPHACELVKAMWHLPQREYQYFAIELLAQYRRQWQPDLIELAEYLITHKSWWDTVDTLISLIGGPYCMQFPDQLQPVTARWNHSDNIWLQRSSILFQNKYKKQTDTALLSQYIVHLSGSKEFFVQKAIGWALREYFKTDPDWVIRFVRNHPLAPLSKREALKHAAPAEKGA